MKQFFLYLLLLLCGTVHKAAAQQDAELEQRLRNKNNLTDIMQEVKSYYKEPATQSRLGNEVLNRALKKWKRWEWYMSSRLGPNGEFVNINKKLTEATATQQNRNLAPISGTDAVQSAYGNWLAVGPLNTTDGIGRVDRLAFHPNNANIVYAGSTAGGLWRTIDGGANWTNLTPNISSGGISGIVIDPNNTNNMYILTGDGDSDFPSGGGLVQAWGYMRLSIGVLRSTDGGLHWNKTGDFPGVTSDLTGFRLVMHPTNSNILYACTNQGLFWTINGGETWGLQKGGGRFHNLKFRPGSNSICYATSDDGNVNQNRTFFWRSTTSGVIWDSIGTINNQINNPTSRVELAVAPSNINVVYLLCGGVSVSGQFKGLFRSGDMGLTFTRQSNTPNIVGRSGDGSDAVTQSNYDLTVAASNINSATVVTGAVNAWRSTNSGVSWTFSGNLHDDVHELAYHPADNKLWAATDGGVYSSTDNGATWTSHFEDMNTSQFYRMDVNPDNYVEIIAGAQDNGVKRRTASSFFDAVNNTNDGFTVAYDQADPSIFYAILNRGLTRYTNNGVNSNGITPPGAQRPFAMSLATHASLGNALFLGADSIWRSTNGGSTWSVSPADGGWFIRTCPSNANKIYAAGGTSYLPGAGVLRRSDDAGATWPAGDNILSNNTDFPVDYTKITSINVEPDNSSNVWVTFGGFTEGVKVYYSNNSGGQWFNRSGSLPNVPVNCIALDSDNNAYIGTDNGIYYRSTSMSDWMPFYNNLPYVSVTDLVISEADGVIRAATYGRGIWSSTLKSSCGVDLYLGGTLEGQEFYEVSNAITSTAILDSTEGTKVQMRGGFEIILQPGFSAWENTQFKALIGPCGGGGVAGFTAVTDSSRLSSGPLTPLTKNRKALLYVKPLTNGLSTVVTALQAGDISFALTDAGGRLLQQWPASPHAKGEAERQLPLNSGSITPGLYYLHLFHNGVWQHQQEVEIK
ncbi:MAG: 3-coathanger stack domain-containing protein [Bacteroidota bacterium]